MGIDFREEGEEWVAYLVGAGTKPVKLGSIAIGAAINSQKVREKFMRLIKLLVEEMGEQTIGEKPTFGIPTPYRNA